MGPEEILSEYKLRLSLYSELAERLKQCLVDLCKANDVRFHAIEARPKGPQSLYDKVTSNGEYTQLSDITDLAAARIITYFSDDVEMAARIVKHEFEIDVLNSVDKRAVLDPDRFGYLSLHYVASFGEARRGLAEYRKFDGLKFEIQIRSLLQHAWSEIQHNLYKRLNGSSDAQSRPAVIPVSLRRKLSRVAGLLEVADEDFLAIKKTTAELDAVRLPVFRSECLSETLVEFTISVEREKIACVQGNDDVYLCMNTNVTNRVLPGGYTEAVMALDNAHAKEGLYRGSVAGANALRFPGVLPLIARTKEKYIIFRFRNVRVNASQRGAQSVICAALVMQRGDVTLSSERWSNLALNVPVAEVRQSIEFRVEVHGVQGEPFRFSRAAGVNGPLATTGDLADAVLNLEIQFNERLAGAIRTSDQEESIEELTVESGTRLMVTFTEIPAGVQVFVTARNIPVEDNHHIEMRLVDTDLNGAGRLAARRGHSHFLTVGQLPDSTPVVRLHGYQFGGPLFAVWECVSCARSEHLREVKFGVLFAAKAGEASTGTGKVTGTLAPLSTVTLSDEFAPIPRFAPLSNPLREAIVVEE